MIAPAEFTEHLMRSRLRESFGRRRRPRVRSVLGRAGPFAVLDQRRTRRAAFRAARELRDRWQEHRPLRVFALPMQTGRRTVDWAVAVRRSR